MIVVFACYVWLCAELACMLVCCVESELCLLVLVICDDLIVT